MKGRRVLAVLLVSSFLAACGTGGEALLPGCESSARNPSTANLLSLQAVPTARYTPCINALPLGWDNASFNARNGEAGVEIGRFGSIFLSATVSEACDTTGAIEVPGPQEDIRRYERIEFTEAEVGITIIPEAMTPLLWSRTVASDLDGADVDDRPLDIAIDDRIDEALTSRIALAMRRGFYVWIVDELGAEEGLLEMRSNTPGASARGITVDDALELIGQTLPEVRYRGEWFFTFEGGCITYSFDAKDRVAATIADDTETAIGFYPAAELREIGEDLGYHIIP